MQVPLKIWKKKERSKGSRRSASGAISKLSMPGTILRHRPGTGPELVAREQLKQVVTNRVSQFFTADSFKVEGKEPLVIRFL